MNVNGNGAARALEGDLVQRGLWAPPEAKRLPLRDYQEEALDRLRAGYRRGHRRQILCAPCGAGKTVIAAEMIRAAVERGSRVTFVADRLALIWQTSDRLADAGIEHGVISGAATYGKHLPVQVASAQTIERRAGAYAASTRLLIIDEAHTMRKGILAIAENAKHTAVVGLTATPFVRNLGKHYSAVVNARTTDELRAAGWVTPLRTYCATPIQMAGAQTNAAGEWTTGACEERALPIVGDVVKEWVRHTEAHFGGAAKTLVFASSVAHGRELCREFGEAGYRFEQVSYLDSRVTGANGEDRRRRLIDAFRAGELDGLVSVEALAKGLDVPDVRVVVVARPLRRSLASHIQMIGRGMRPAPNKEYCLLLDHARNYLRHAWATERFWRLGCDALSTGKEQKEQAAAPEQTDRKCPRCDLVLPPGSLACPACGSVRERRSDVEVAPGRMEEYVRLEDAAGGANLWDQVAGVGAGRFPSDAARAKKWAMAQYRAMFGVWPPRGAWTPAREVAPEVRRAVYASYDSWLAARREDGWK